MLPFECKQCGACCYGEGGIRVQDHEVERISSFLGLSPHAFAASSCVQKHGNIYIACKADGFCLFYDPEVQCRIHPVKPEPCALWPFYPALLRDKDNWEMAKGACPGISANCSFEEFLRQAEE